MYAYFHLRIKQVKDFGLESFYGKGKAINATMDI